MSGILIQPLIVGKTHYGCSGNAHHLRMWSGGMFCFTIQLAYGFQRFAFLGKFFTYARESSIYLTKLGMSVKVSGIEPGPYMEKWPFLYGGQPLDKLPSLLQTRH
jgi:hypothetical protein